MVFGKIVIRPCAETVKPKLDKAEKHFAGDRPTLGRA
jgi:hypothetical protein